MDAIEDASVARSELFCCFLRPDQLPLFRAIKMF